MASKTLRIGIIGRHFGNTVHAPAFQMVDDCELAGVFSRDWRTLIEDPRIDAVSIAVPPAVQREIATSVLDAKKHVFLEKPVAANAEIAGILLSKSKSAGVVSMVNFELPFMKTWTEAKRIIDSGDLGRLEEVDVEWTSMSYSRGEFDDSWKFNPTLGGGLLNNFGSHVFNYVEHFFGRVVAISCQQEFVAHGQKVKFDVGVTLNLKTKAGFPVSIRMSGRGPRPLHKIHVKGSHASLTLHNASSDYVSGFVLKKGETIIADEKQSLLHEDGRIWATHQVAKRFVESIQSGKLNAPTLVDGVRAEELMKLAAQSSTSHQEVASS